MQPHDILEIPRGNTRRQIKVEVGLVLLCRRQVLKLAREMVFKGDHGRNHDCKRPDPRYKMYLYQGNN